MDPPPIAMSSRPEISVVVPVHDEEENLPLLQHELAAALDTCGRSWECVYVDDGSRDDSLQVLLRLRARDPGRIRVVQFARNAGQTAAMAAGFDHARGAVVVTLDADLQNDPADIPRLLAKLDEGFDIVAGWRKRRHDGLVLRKLPSRVANRLIALATGVKIHDTGCTLKAFRAELVRNLPIYAEQHRFLPAMSAGSGARVAEIVVNHRARRHGRSKYGLGRAGRVLLDLLAIRMVSGFSHRPLSYFMLIALAFGAGVLSTALLHEWFRTGGSFDEATLGAGFVVVAVTAMTTLYFMMLGLLAELAVKASGMHRPGEARVLVTRMQETP